MGETMILDRLRSFVSPKQAVQVIPPSVNRQLTPSAHWMRDSGSHAMAGRHAYIVDNPEDVLRVWDRVSALALDLIQNSGRLKGAMDQVLADTIGCGLKLTPKPKLARLGYGEQESAAFAKIVAERWKLFADNPDEVDLRGKFNLHQLADVGLRHFVAYGEQIGIVDYMPPELRKQYGISNGTKLLMVVPHRLKRDTDELIRLRQGVYHDENGRAIGYRFLEKDANGWNRDRDYAARDANGRTLVHHAFDPWDAADCRGLSVLAASLKTQAMADKLGDVTLETAILQTTFAATLTSPEPSQEAYQSIEALNGVDPELELGPEFLGYLAAKFEAARENTLNLNGSQVNHLAPGEELKFQTASTPGGTYLPFSMDLRRELARALGVTYESFTLDQSGATYSSVRMGNASIWPVVMRRRERISAQLYQAVYESWLDEEIGEGRIPIKGGYRAFAANRNEVVSAEWQGPPPPTADDMKSALAQTERLVNGTSTLEAECQASGLDWRDVVRQRALEMAEYEKAGLPNPFQRVQGGGPQDEATAAPPKKQGK